MTNYRRRFPNAAVPLAHPPALSGVLMWRSPNAIYQYVRDWLNAERKLTQTRNLADVPATCVCASPHNSVSGSFMRLSKKGSGRATAESTAGFTTGSRWPQQWSRHTEGRWAPRKRQRNAHHQCPTVGIIRGTVSYYTLNLRGAAVFVSPFHQRCTA